MISRSTDIKSALRSRQRGFLLNPYVFSSGGGGDPYYANVSLGLHGDGANDSTTFTDNSPAPKTFTSVGNARISTAQSKFGGASIYFDGTGDKLVGPVSTDFNFGTEDFTIETYVRLVGWGGSGIFGLYYTSLVGCREQNTSGGWSLWLVGTSTSKTAISFSIGTAIDFSYSFSLNTWYHVCVARHTGVLYGFVDGVLLGNTAFTGNTGVSKALGVGYHQDTVRGDTFFLNGYIDDLRVTKGVARYTANFTPPTAAFPDA